MRPETCTSKHLLDKDTPRASASWARGAESGNRACFRKDRKDRPEKTKETLHRDPCAQMAVRPHGESPQPLSQC